MSMAKQSHESIYRSIPLAIVHGPKSNYCWLFFVGEFNNNLWSISTRRSNVWHGINFLNSCRGLLHPRLPQWWQWTLLYCASLSTLQSPSLSVPVLTRKRPLCLECAFICCSLSLSVHVCALEFLTHPLLSQGGHCPTQSYIGVAYNVRQAQLRWLLAVEPNHEGYSTLLTYPALFLWRLQTGCEVLQCRHSYLRWQL